MENYTPRGCAETVTAQAAEETCLTVPWIWAKRRIKECA